MIVHPLKDAVKTAHTPTPDPFDPGSTGMDGIPIKIGNRVSGFYMPRTKTYYRRINGSKHLLKKPIAITNDVEALMKAEALGADRVRIVDSETDIEYSATIQLIHEYGVAMNRGFGDQLYLLLGYWIRTDLDGTVYPPTLPKQAPAKVAEPEQPTLLDHVEPSKRSAY